MRRLLAIGGIAVVVIAVVVVVYGPRVSRARALSGARHRWEACAIRDYSWTLEAGGSMLGGSTRFEVRDGRPAGRDPGWGALPPGTYPRTVDELFDRIGAAVGADLFTATYDPNCGYPVRVSVDPSRNATDDEYGFSVTDLAPSA